MIALRWGEKDRDAPVAEQPELAVLGRRSARVNDRHVSCAWRSRPGVCREMLEQKRKKYKISVASRTLGFESHALHNPTSLEVGYGG